ncbi:hypothetical protein [Vibrio phage vB_VmeM-Yong XC32]|nr:hypothetical protein [Vibrio phage vB_VmeM-Yong XC31]QAX96521.1 hypothetical protein [Vibrio phage vB_VmeM-Yong XC32]QAX96839.1 hypothetical protein [Vibrio phage vB_VmeM-Yong MS31]
MSDNDMLYSIPPVILELLDLPQTGEVMRNHMGEHALIQFRHMPALAEGSWVDQVAEVLEKGAWCTWDETGQHVKAFHFCLPDAQATLVFNDRPEVTEAVRTITHEGAGIYRVETKYTHEDREVLCVKLFSCGGKRLVLREWYCDGELKTTVRQTWDDNGELAEAVHEPPVAPEECVKVLSKAGRTEKLEISHKDALPTIFIRDRFHAGDLRYRHQVREDGEFPKSFLSVGDGSIFTSLAGDLKEITLRDDKGRRVGYYCLNGSCMVVDRIYEGDASYSTSMRFPINGLPDFNALENARKELIFGWKPDDDVEI